MKKLSEKYYLMYDYMINHISAHSEIYHDFLEKKDASEYRDFFIRFKDFWKNGEPTEEQISKIYLRKEQPYIEAEFADGTKEKLWCTFSPEQIDINCLGSEKAKEYLEEKLKFLSDHGASLIRLDALAYASKREDTNCFFVEPEIWKIVDQCEKHWKEQILRSFLRSMKIILFRKSWKRKMYILMISVADADPECSIFWQNTLS